MNLVIHDLNAEQWKKISGDYEDCAVIADNGGMHPCVGCFSCWSKDPGRCRIKDGYENIGAMIHYADEVTVISRYTYGGFSGSVKNVFDRCLGYILPQFEVINGETHHKKRYDEDKPFTFIFYGSELSDQEKELARRYVQAVCANIRGHIKDVFFRECAEEPETEKKTCVSDGKAVLLNVSMRSARGNSAKLARELMKQLKNETQAVDLKDCEDDIPGLLRVLAEAQAIVLCTPLYVDGLPAQALRLMERFEKEYHGGSKKIYVLANMGLYESSQLVNLFSAVKLWCGRMGFDYCGGLGVSAGELIGGFMKKTRFGFGPTKNAADGMRRLAVAVDTGLTIRDIYAEPHSFPRSLYLIIANVNWNRIAKKRGIKPKDMYRQL